MFVNIIDDWVWEQVFNGHASFNEKPVYYYYESCVAAKVQ